MSKLNPKTFPKLFFIIISIKDLENFNNTTTRLRENLRKIEKYLDELMKNRPLILQISFDDNSMFCYKHQKSLHFVELNQNIENHNNLLTALSSSNDDVLYSLFDEKNSSTILRLLKATDFPEEEFNDLILNCALLGSKCDLMAMLDTSFADDGKLLNVDAQNILRKIFEEKNESILSNAIKNRNLSVANYLIFTCTQHIQQLPFAHQVDITTTAYKTKRIEILHNLIKFSEFPFPKKFDEIFINDTNLSHLIQRRKEFNKMIILGCNIDEIVKEHSNLKIVYDTDNKSILYNAYASKKFEIYVKLKSMGYQLGCDKALPELTDKEQEELSKIKLSQTNLNIKNAHKNGERSAQLLAARSLIHNTNNMHYEKQYREKIAKFFNKLSRNLICCFFLDCAAQCEDLQIVFDFESEYVSKKIKIIFS